MPRQGSRSGPGGVFFRRWGCHGYLCRDCAAGGLMDRFALRLLVGAVLVWWCASASAALVSVPFVWRGGGHDGESGPAWCAKVYAALGGTLTVDRAYPAVTNPPQWECAGRSTGNVNWGYVAVLTCVGGSWNATLQACFATVTSCPAGQAADSRGVCRSICPAFGTQSGSSSSTVTTRGDAFLVCIGDCQYAPSVSAKQSDGAWASWGPFTSMGLNCTGSESGTGAPAPATCPPAQCMGEINGTAVCKPCGDVREPPKTTDTTAPPADAGSAPAGATPGSSSTTEQTSCTGGQCTTTRTTTTVGSSGGQTSQTSTTTQPIGTYCSVNPGAAVCAGLSEGQEEEPSTWGGSCAGFACGGDAVQCAIAREQHTRNCALFDQQTDLSRAGYTAASGDDPADHPRKNAQVVTFGLSTMLDTTPLFGGSGGCPSDYSFAYAGHTLVIPFSQACPTLHMLGAIWMGLSYLMAATIVFYRR